MKHPDDDLISLISVAWVVFDILITLFITGLSIFMWPEQGLVTMVPVGAMLIFAVIVNILFIKEMRRIQ